MSGIAAQAHPPFAHPKMGLEMSDSFPPRGRRQNFMPENPLIQQRTSGRLSLAFSLSRSFSRPNSYTSSPPYFDFQL